MLDVEIWSMKEKTVVSIHVSCSGQLEKVAAKEIHRELHSRVLGT